MSTIKDFKNAPVGARATREETGSRAMKMDDIERRWITPNGVYLADEEMEQRGFTLDPLDPAPTTAREALDLAWELAHEVKEGQVVPEGTHLLDRLDRNDFSAYTALVGFTIISTRESLNIRTLEPLPEPEPDWLDAPAVLATCGYCETKALHGPFEGRSRWECAKCQITTTWRALTDVTPLYPKETNK